MALVLNPREAQPANQTIEQGARWTGLPRRRAILKKKKRRRDSRVYSGRNLISLDARVCLGSRGFNNARRHRVLRRIVAAALCAPDRLVHVVSDVGSS